MNIGNCYRCDFENTLSWEDFLLGYYETTIVERKRDKAIRGLMHKARTLANHQKTIIVLEVDLIDPELLRYTDEFGWNVPVILDDYKTNLRNRIPIDRNHVMHVFDVDTYNDDIRNFLKSNCEIDIFDREQM